jgi:tellurite resistance-related uncharacterized protein
VQEEAAEAEWLAKLTDVEAKKEIFSNLSKTNEGDHPHLKYIKGKIGKILKQEIEYLNFTDQVKNEEEAYIAQSVYNKAVTKSNFYFSIDENKRDTNLKIFNPKAPGNHYRHPSVILPHENVHIQRYMNVKDLTEEKMTEIYAFYNQLIDLHISQIRP